MFRSRRGNPQSRLDVGAAVAASVASANYVLPIKRASRFKPSLLAKFSIISFALMLMTGTLLGYSLTYHFEQQALDQHRVGVSSLVVPIVGASLKSRILERGAFGDDYVKIEKALANLGGSGLVAVRILNADGMIIYSDAPEQVGHHQVVTRDLIEALDGVSTAVILPGTETEDAFERGYGQLMRIYVPLYLPGERQIVAAFEGFYDVDDLRARIAGTNNFLWTSTMVGFLCLYISLFTIVRTASHEVIRRNNEKTVLLTDLQRSNIELALAYDVTLEGWSRALDLRDKETEGHTQRVTEMTVRLARAMGVSEAELVQIQRGALLHDIGKMGIPDAILLKPGPLTDAEWEIMRRHPVYAYELLSPIAFLKGALDIPYCHHEKWDGTGYPRGLKGEQIPLSARIFAIVDVWDALRSDRPYRAAWGEERVREHIRSLSGTHFDPRVVKAFLGLDSLQAMKEIVRKQELPQAKPEPAIHKRLSSLSS